MLKEYSKEYVVFLNNLKDKIINSQQKAVMSVNIELLMLYWNIGNLILKKQSEGILQDIIIDELSKDLKIAFPNMQSFSEKNLKYMCKFAEEYKDEKFVKQVASKISWSHNIVLIDKVSDYNKKIYYINKIVENSWEKNTLFNQIELEFETDENLEENNNLEDIAQEQSNDIEHISIIENKPILNDTEEYNITLEEIVEDNKDYSEDENDSQDNISIQLLKDSYILDFLTFLEEEAEKDLEKQFKNHVTKYFLELNSGFAFVGNDYHIEVQEEDYYVGLLFYNLKIRCYVNIELKIGSFRPEYLGKLSFYLSLIDDKLKREHDKPAIGIVLCKDEEKLIVQYAFKDITKSEKDTEYSLTQDIPKEFKSSLPTVKEIGLGIKEKFKG